MNKFEIMGEPKKPFFVDETSITSVETVGDLIELVKKSGSCIVNVNSLGSMRSFIRSGSCVYLNSHGPSYMPKDAEQMAKSHSHLLVQLEKFRSTTIIYAQNMNTFDAKVLKRSEHKLISAGRIYKHDDVMKIMLYVHNDERLKIK